MDQQKAIQFKKQIEYVHKTSNNIEYHLRNSLEIEFLMKIEEDGLGQWTITQLLNSLQDMYSNGETESYYALANRQKRLNE